jgi:hypothetical protein
MARAIAKAEEPLPTRVVDQVAKSGIASRRQSDHLLISKYDVVGVKFICALALELYADLQADREVTGR